MIPFFLQEKIKMRVWRARNSVSANASFNVQSLLLVTATLLVKETMQRNTNHAVGCKMIQ